MSALLLLLLWKRMRFWEAILVQIIVVSASAMRAWQRLDIVIARLKALYSVIIATVTQAISINDAGLILRF